MKAADVKAEINERIIKALSEGKIPWLKPWTENGPRNLFSSRAYTGLNRLILGLSSYPLPFWATYRQYLAAGLQVQKGEHGTGIIYAGRTVKTDTKTDENGEEKESKKQIRFLKAFVVFNVAQTDYKEKGYKLPDLKENAHLLGCDEIILEYTGRESIRITEGNRAAYSPQMDIITCPEIGQFRTSEHYYATMCHECIHSTGPRLDRFKRTDPVCFGSDTYGREELVAEIGSAYLAALTGIDSSAVVKNQAAYLQNWATAIKADADLVMYAAGRAEKATDFMIGASAPVPPRRNRNGCSGRGGGMTSIYDAMPIKVLEELERIETTIPEIERRAFTLQADAQDLRYRHDEIINSWKLRAEREGLDNLIAERHRLEMIAWVCDPLPCRGRV